MAELEELVGKPHCLTDPEVVAGFTTDWTGRYGGPALAVVRPADTAETAAVLALLGREGASAVPQGGKTGLVGGSVPRPAGEQGARPEVVVSMRRLDEIAPGEEHSGLLAAGGGTTLAAAQQAAARRGSHLGIDLAARESATLGGMVATNAGGIHVVRYGPMRARLGGIEVVLADGTVASQLSGLKKDNVGVDLGALISGSEGTLGVVTKVLVRLEPLPAHRVTALVAVSDAAAAVRLATGPLQACSSLEAAELTLRDGMELVSGHAGLPDPAGTREGAGAWLTVEAAGGADPLDELAAVLDDPAVLAVAVATDDASRARLWAYRERHTEAISSLGVPHKLDVAVPPWRLAELLEAVRERVGSLSPSARLICFGHVADGNLHVNVVGPPPDDETVDDAVFELVLLLGGSISAEHGVGVAKRRFLDAARPPGTLAVMARLKSALDPGRVLNPGVLEPRVEPASR